MLLFSYLGYSTKKVVIKRDKSKYNINLAVNLEASGCTLMGKIAVNKIYSSKQ